MNLYRPAFEQFQKFLDELVINLNEQRLLEILKISKRFPYQFHTGQESVCMIDNVGTKLRNDLFKRDGFLDYNKFIYYYNNGFASIISDVLDLTEELQSIEKKCYELFACRANGNFYFTKGLSNQNVSFPEHQDPYPIFIKNIYGKSIWRINGDRLDTGEQKVHFMMPNTPHFVTSILEPRLSLTIGIYQDV